MVTASKKHGSVLSPSARTAGRKRPSMCEGKAPPRTPNPAWGEPLKRNKESRVADLRAVECYEDPQLLVRPISHTMRTHHLTYARIMAIRKAKTKELKASPAGRKTLVEAADAKAHRALVRSIKKATIVYPGIFLHMDQGAQSLSDLALRYGVTKSRMGQLSTTWRKYCAPLLATLTAPQIRTAIEKMDFVGLKAGK